MTFFVGVKHPLDVEIRRKVFVYALPPSPSHTEGEERDHYAQAVECGDQVSTLRRRNQPLGLPSCHT